MDLADFEISIDTRADEEYEVSVRSSVGESRGRMRLPFDAPALENRLLGLQNALLRSTGGRRDLGSAEQRRMAEEFGGALFEALLPDGVNDTYRMALARAREQQQGLRVRLRIQAPELAVLPWELLYDRREGDFVALSPETPLVRYLELGRPPAPAGVALPLRILGMVASPRDLPPLDVAAERALVERAVERLQREDAVRLRWVESGSFQDLQAAMRRGPWHIFHFVGHGGFDAQAAEGLVAFESPDPSPTGERGAAHLVPASVLGQLLNGHPSLRLALLNACEGARGSTEELFSSTAAVLVRRGIPAVVAMQHEITAVAALEFAQAFYASVADGVSVDTAMAHARTAIRGQLGGSLEWSTPVLYMRAPSGNLFSIPPRPATFVRPALVVPPAADAPAAAAASAPRVTPTSDPAAAPAAAAAAAPGRTPGERRAPARRRALAGALVAAALALPAALAATHVGAVDIELQLQVSEVTALLAEPQPLGGVVSLASLGAAGLRALELPDGALTDTTLLETDLALLAVDPDSATGRVALDLAALPLPAGTRVTVRPLGDDPRDYRLALRGAVPSVGAAMDGAVRLVSGGRERQLDLDTPTQVRLHPATNELDTAIVDLDLRLPEDTTLQLGDAVSVTDLRLLSVEQTVDLEETIVREVSTILGGTLSGPALGWEWTLERGEQLRFTESSGTIRALTLGGGVVGFTFDGEVRGMSTGTDDDPTSLMPSRLDALRARYGGLFYVAAALYVAGVAWLAARLWRAPA